MAIDWNQDLDTANDTKNQIIGIIVLLVIVVITFWVIMRMKKRK